MYKTFKIGGYMRMMVLLLLPVLAFTIFIGSCTQKVAFQRSSVVPAADADVRVKTDRNGNYELDIRVQNLAQPENLSPSRETYVVWMLASDQNTYNLGELQVGDNLRGSLTAVTPHRPIRVYISAEDDATGRAPSDQVVLEADGF
jgi:hypothetical protein